MNRFKSAGVHNPVTPFMNRCLQPESVPLMAVLSFLLSAGCTTQHYRKSADKEAYGAVAQKTPLVKNMDEHFSKLMDQGLPTEARAYLGMLGFRIVMNYHGEVLGVEQPGMPGSDGDED